MNKRVVDLSFDELSRLASQAGGQAVRKTLAAGTPVTGRLTEAEMISTHYPDGSIRPLNPAREPRPAQSCEPSSQNVKFRGAVA